MGTTSSASKASRACAAACAAALAAAAATAAAAAVFTPLTGGACCGGGMKLWLMRGVGIASVDPGVTLGSNSMFSSLIFLESQLILNLCFVSFLFLISPVVRSSCTGTWATSSEWLALKPRSVSTSISIWGQVNAQAAAAAQQQQVVRCSTSISSREAIHMNSLQQQHPAASCPR